MRPSPAPATNKEVLDTIYNKFGIALPLEDLFRWGRSERLRQQALKSAYEVGTATIDGVPTDHFAFREDDVDWEVWIQTGRPAAASQAGDRRPHRPGKADLHRPPQLEVNPAFTDADFTFVPDANAKRIQLATFKGAGE